MNLIDYTIPYFYEDFEMFEHYYLNKDGWLLSKIDKKLINEYYNGSGFGLTDYIYDTNLIFII